MCNQCTLVPYLTGVVGFDVGSSDQKRNFDVKLVELPLVQWEGELTCRENERTWVGEEHLEHLQMSRRSALKRNLKGLELPTKLSVDPPEDNYILGEDLYTSCINVFFLIVCFKIIFLPRSQ